MQGVWCVHVPTVTAGSSRSNSSIRDSLPTPIALHHPH